MERKIENRVIRVYGIFGNHRAGSVYSVNGLCLTLDANGGGYYMPLILIKGGKKMLNIKQFFKDNPKIVCIYINNKIFVKNGTHKGYLEAKEGDCIDISYNTSFLRRGRVQKRITQTITTNVENSLVVVVE